MSSVKTFLLSILFNVTIILLLLISCTSTNNSTRDKKKQALNIENQIIKDNNGAEDFPSFLDFFEQDSSFQFERTVAPYITSVELVTINEAGDLKAIILTSHDISAWVPLTGVLKEPHYIELKNDSARIICCEHILYRNICSNYIFTRLSGKWHFKSLVINTNPKAI